MMMGMIGFIDLSIRLNGMREIARTAITKKAHMARETKLLPINMNMMNNSSNTSFILGSIRCIADFPGKYCPKVISPNKYIKTFQSEPSINITNGNNVSINNI